MNISILPKIKNKKADLSVVVLVFLVLILCSYTIYSMSSNRQKISNRITGYSEVENLLLEKKDFEYLFFKTSEECLIKSYDSSFSELEEKEKMNEEFIKRLERETSICINTEMKKSNKEKNFDKVEIKILNNLLDISITNLQLVDSKEMFYYTINLDNKIPFEKLGLMNLEDIEKILGCYEEANCDNLEDYNTFDVTVENNINKDNVDVITYQFSSKKEFLIENKLRKIEFNMESRIN